MDIINIFILSCFIGYFSISQVTPTLHSPLMSVTNAISGIVIIGALDALKDIQYNSSPIFLYLAIFFASINIFGGFIVSNRMLKMFKPKETNKWIIILTPSHIVYLF